MTKYSFARGFSGRKRGWRSTRIRDPPLRFAADKAALLGERSDNAGAG